MAIQLPHINLRLNGRFRRHFDTNKNGLFHFEISKYTKTIIVTPKCSSRHSAGSLCSHWPTFLSSVWSESLCLQLGNDWWARYDWRILSCAEAVCLGYPSLRPDYLRSLYMSPVDVWSALGNSSQIDVGADSVVNFETCLLHAPSNSWRLFATVNSVPNYREATRLLKRSSASPSPSTIQLP